MLQIEQYLENQQPDAAEVKAEDVDDEGDQKEADEQEEPEPQ